jgi:pimeloyl-ACP methyl ester carboxylesterase
MVAGESTRTGSRVNVVRRGRGWVWLVVTTVVVLAVTSIVFIMTRSDARSHAPPFDLRTVGAACGNDRSWVCSSIRVPIDRRSPAAGSLRVSFRVLPRRLASKPSSGTVVVVAGGPGDSSISQYVWARRAFRSLLADHDLLLVDNRGSGASDPIHCPEAEQSFTLAAAVQCRTLLGSRADDYGTVAAVDDLDAVLRYIHASDVDLYGESYGTFFAQVFALRHPQGLQRLVLDGALPLDPDPWRVASIAAGLAALRTVCQTDAACNSLGDPDVLLGRVLTRLRAGTDVGNLRSEGPPLLAVQVEGAGFKGSAYRELPAALHSYLNGDILPLVRLANEAFHGGASAGPTLATENAGLLLADDCADFPLPFDLRAPLARQRRQLNDARARVATASARELLPFTAREALSREPDICVGWPAPKNPPPRAQDQTFPNVPTLVLEGALDTVTTAQGARSVAREFPDGRYLEVPFVRHITALRDDSGCAANIAATFLASKTINTACLSRIEPPTQVDAFPRTFAEETPITPITYHGKTTLSADERRTIAVARDAIADVLRRWGTLRIYSGRGLRGGTFTTIQATTPDDFSVHLNAYRWTTDTTVTGDLTTSPTAHTLNGSVVVTTLNGPVKLFIRSPRIVGASTQETVAGEIRGYPFDMTIDARIGL